MDYISILEKFKKDNVRAGEVMPFSLMPFLFLELESNGFTQEQISNDFYKQALAILFANEERGVHSYALEEMFVYSERLPLTKKEEVKKEEPKKPQPVATTKGQFISTEHLVDNIPDESDEGDGLSTPIEDVISLKPEDFADYEIDWEFAESIGLKRPQP